MKVDVHAVKGQPHIALAHFEHSGAPDCRREAFVCQRG